VFPKHQRPHYEPSKRRVTFHTGSMATAYSADEPERLRGPQHEWAWGDEPASWRFGKAAYDNLMLGLRLGDAPWAMLTGTPKPTAWLREMTAEDSCVTTTGSTYENAANLATLFLTDILGKYEGTRLGRQELHAEWLDDVEGALWTMRTIDLGRIGGWSASAPWRGVNEWLFRQGRPMLHDRRPWRTIVAVDPPGETAECGISVGAAPVNAVAGRDHAVLLDDASMAGRPEAWGAQVVATAKKWGQGDPCVVYVESNQGGDMVRSTIHAVDPNITVKKIHAKDSKQARAEPISALYEKGWIHHVGFMAGVETQMTTWVPREGRSPDRLDSAVHLFRELLRNVNTAKARVQSPVRSQQRVPT